MVHSEPASSLRGRGASENPPNRFERLVYVRDADARDPAGLRGAAAAPQTIVLKDTTRSIITYNDSPDVGFNASINPYRGCEHGCIYCYARPFHEYLGFSAGLDFVTRILVKEDAPALLREELASPKWKPQLLAISGVTDAYQPIEKKLEITRRCLDVLVEFRNPVAIITKNQLVSRDADLLSELARFNAAAVFVSITTLDADLARTMEPRTSTPSNRLAAISALTEAGVPVGVLAAPVVPGLTDHELPQIVEAACRAGARYAGYVMLRLPHGVADLFQAWLEEHFPDRKKKVLNKLRDIRDGRLNDPNFKTRMRGSGIYAEQVRSLFTIACKRNGIIARAPALSTEAFKRPGVPQMALFDV